MMGSRVAASLLFPGQGTRKTPLLHLSPVLLLPVQHLHPHLHLLLHHPSTFLLPLRRCWKAWRRILILSTYWRRLLLLLSPHLLVLLLWNLVGRERGPRTRKSTPPTLMSCTAPTLVRRGRRRYDQLVTPFPPSTSGEPWRR